jgi:hypothetical protein
MANFTTASSEQRKITIYENFKTSDLAKQRTTYVRKSNRQFDEAYK